METSAHSDSAVPCVSGKAPILLYATVTGIGLALALVSQSAAFHGDEGFHLLGARLIGLGKTPYVDFFYQHPPLFLYCAGAWMKLFGPGWRSAHALSALLTAGSIWLVAQYLYSRVPERRWRTAAAMLGAAFLGLHLIVLRFGTIGHPYALCLLLVVAAYRLAVLAADTESGWPTAAAGATAAAAAMSSLLTAPVAPILLAWLLWQARRGHAVRKLGFFAAGALVPVLPVFWLAAQAPRAVFFDIVEYHLFYRRLDFPDTTYRGVRTLANWFTSSQGLLLAVPAVAGFLHARMKNGLPARRRAELSLCAALAGGLALYLMFARPTFFEYFVMMVPFLSILASLGACELAGALWPATPPALLILPLAALFSVASVRWFWLRAPDFRFGWRQVDEIAREVDQVTPPNATVYANEAVCFASGRLPSPGMENPYTRYLKLPPGLAAAVRAVPEAEIDRWLAEGRFATVVMWSRDPKIESLGLARLYTHGRELNGQLIFWDKVAARSEP